VAGAPVNINTASASELDTLKGVGPALAQRIIEERARGAFRRVEEITRVRGIGPKILEDNFYRMTVQ
jgi:competence protein ComEA